MSDGGRGNGAGAERREESRLAEAARLDGEILSAIGRGWNDPLSEEEFDALARDVFAHQFRFHPVYRRFCGMHDVGAPPDVSYWRAIPPVPAGAFKVGRWATFPPDREVAAFRTSGTTRGTAGVHRFETLALYNAAILPPARRFLLPDRPAIRLLVLSPSPAGAPDSSLVHMFAVWREVLGAPGSAFFLTGPPDRGALRTDHLVEALDRAVEEGEPVAVCGAARAHHHVLAMLDGSTWRLPEGSRAMVTGGFKGVRGSTDPTVLGRAIGERLGIPREMRIEEYGMTELSSQAYEPELRSALTGEIAEAEGFVAPPWTRVRVVDPLTGEDVPDGEEGVLVHVDLANRASAVAVQTSDRGVRTGERSFLLRGREPGAEARGCSLAADLWFTGDP